MLSFLSSFFETLVTSCSNLLSAFDNLSDSLSSALLIFWFGFLAVTAFSAAFWYLDWALDISWAYFSKALSKFLSTFWVNFKFCFSVLAISFWAFSASLAALSEAFDASLAALSAAFAASLAALSATFAAAFAALSAALAAAFAALSAAFAAAFSALASALDAFSAAFSSFDLA